MTFSFGEYIDGKGYKVLNERSMRGSGALMFLIGIVAFVFTFIIKNYNVLPYLSGFMVLNFSIGIFINPNYCPTLVVASFLVRKQTPLFVGAIQKRFAWSLGLSMALAIFILSLLLLNNENHFTTLLILCSICLLLIYLEMGFGICIGCKIYHWAIRMKIIPKPKENPNCIGDSCVI